MLTIRPACCEEDYQSVLKIESELCALSPAVWHFHFGGIGLDRYLFGNGAADFFSYGYLIFRGPEQIGYALLYREEGAFILELMPAYSFCYPAVLAEMEVTFPQGSVLTTDANSLVSGYWDALEAAGYRKGEESRFQAAIDLRALPCTRVDTAQERVGLLGEGDIKNRVCYAALPTGAAITEGQFRAYLFSPDASRVRDEVVHIKGNGEFAAYLSWWMDESSKTVMLNPVACVERFRGRGIAKRAISLGLQRMRQLGFCYAYVDTGMQNLPARRLYESVGFIKTGEARRFTKKRV
jgi:GNAT superfamily N-acetyltransferase